MSELYKEIEDDLRSERLDKLWNKFGRIMVWVSIGIVLTTIAIVVVQDRRQAYAMEKTTQFMKGIDRMNVEDYKGAIAVFDTLATDESSSYYGLALLRKAQAQTLLDDKAGAAQTYKQLAKKNDAFGDLAKMMSGEDTLVEPSKDSPFYYSLSEWRGWQLLQHGRKDEAVALFLTIYDDGEAPRSLRERVTEALEHIAPDKLSKKLADTKVQE